MSEKKINKVLNLEYPFSMVVTGMPKSGKTAFIKYIFLINSKKFTKDPFKYGIVFSTTAKIDNQYNFLPAKYIYVQYEEHILKNFIDYAAKHHDKTFVVFDDCLDKKAFNSKLFIDFITTYRHFNINVIIASQYVKILTPTMRESCRYVVMFKQVTDKSIGASYENFGYGFKTFVEFREFLLKNTENHSAVFVDKEQEGFKKIYKPIKIPDPKTFPEFKFTFGEKKDKNSKS